MGRLDGRDDADGVYARLVVWVDDLCVFNAETVVALAGGQVGVGGGLGTLLLEGGDEGVYGVAVGEVADGVDVDLVAGCGPGFGYLCEGGGVDEEGAGCPGVVGVRGEHS